MRGSRKGGSTYFQYWLYYADSATLRDIPVAGAKGYHRDDWEGVQFRFGPDGRIDQRASSHHGYNSGLSFRNWGSDAGIAPLEDVAGALGARSDGGWGPATHFLLVSGGSHAGSTIGFADLDRFTPGRRVHLVPLEPIAASSDTRFAVSPPWLKQAWLDPETEQTQ